MSIIKLSKMEEVVKAISMVSAVTGDASTSIRRTCRAHISRGGVKVSLELFRPSVD